MIDELDRSLERWLRAGVPLPNAVAEISFDTPDKDWDARRSTPVVDLFLYALVPSKDRAATGSRLIEHDGGLAREKQVPVVDARYLISVWGGGSGVEHDLLSKVMNLLSTSKQIPVEHLSGSLRAVRPAPSVSLAPDEATTTTQLWSSLSVPPRPAIQLLVQTPTGLPVAVPANDPPTSMSLTTWNTQETAATSRRRRSFGRTDPAAAGGRVLTRRGSALIQDSGRYSVEADPGDEVTVLPPQRPGQSGE